MINKKITWSLLRILIPLFIIGLTIIYFTYNKPHKDFNKTPSQFTIESKKLISFYQNSSEDANTKYLDKIILITGTITDFEENIIILDNGIVCTLDPSQKIDDQIYTGSKISIKGRCIGYDDLLEEIRVDHSFVIKR